MGPNISWDGGCWERISFSEALTVSPLCLCLVPLYPGGGVKIGSPSISPSFRCSSLEGRLWDSTSKWALSQQRVQLRGVAQVLVLCSQFLAP